MTKELTTNSDVNKLHEIIEEKLKSIKKVTDTPFRTSGVFDFGKGEIVNVKETKDIRSLLVFAAEVLQTKNSYEEAAKTLGLENYPEFQVLGYSANDVLADIKVRISVLNYETTVKELSQAKEQIESLFSEEERKAKTLKELREKFNLD